MSKIKCVIFLSVCIILNVYTNANLPKEAITLLRGESKFSTNLYQKIASAQEKSNIILSPLSVYNVLSMLAFGAREETAKELLENLFLSNESLSTLTSFKKISDNFKNDGNVRFDTANAILTSGKLNDDYKKKMSEYFDAFIGSIDRNNPSKTVQAINSWTYEKTHHKIKDLLKPGSIGPDTSMILLNAVYFKGEWLKKFSRHWTKDRPFKLDSKTEVNVPTMHRVADLPYGEIPELDALFFRLVFKGEKYWMTIVAPNKVDGLEKIEKNPSYFSPKNLRKIEQVDKATLFLPKFKIESEINLLEPLKQIGFKKIFSSAANFRGITNLSSYVSEILQKAFIEVNEEGTEAAATTLSIMGRSSIPVSIIVDKPFYYALQTEDATIFQGRVMDPRK